ncbi:DNA-binding transcriptional regulator, MarR family [Dethiosulfatibacter aminovorans DSM 17477]|uniref:DNA-binding transcriptional regulator, MarR family n=1 Tax=Dethiosulfatibacter aminovorans DSM 17477 TaxID=1121476 RepID=A0A1M6JNX9_9FIRM|nr:MarR family transcriptional regulator [Dethiosulfatibacter aminovorans]SHJ48390.1 DNA-binding transcriptional regulator, MarR family [Dethiosulfatibacter aminovorans DSM 17477]
MPAEYEGNNETDNDQIIEDIREMGKYLSLFYRKLMLIIGNDLKAINMTTLQSIVLINIKRHEGVNQNELASVVGIDKASVSRVIRDLENRNLLFKEIDQSDRRHFRLFLTDKGKEEVEKSVEIQMRIWLDCMKEINSEELNISKEMMIKLYSNINEIR